ncbi:hypothetical protein [Rhodopila globiformis]|uniref:Uncharacterized protein n=1 Tax=Rhodopila globiformis TaxID=1071 RepID=A0A2S6N501_RHOGL|nr:hypothetical protein [Rhodopila globiformis]PPQ29679.1 hypothetical protein CCS01_21035 [Rhodopila globiformis]
MKRHVLLALVCLGCSPALAQTGAGMVDGDWIGKGAFQLGPTVLACSEIRMKFVGTSTLYGVRDGSIVCESQTQNFPMHDDFEVKPDNEVYYKNQKVGRITGDRLVVLVPGPNDVGTEFTLRREGDLLYYNEVARKPGQPPMFGMVAIMQKDRNAAAKP